MGVYGDFLGPFNELFEDYDVVKCTPKVGGSFDIEKVGSIHAYIQDGESGLNVKDNYSRHSMSGGSATGVVSQLNICYMYTRESVNLFDNFVLYKNSPYRPMTDSNYQKEGDLVITELHLVVGNTGIDEHTIELTKGAFD